MQWFPWRQTCGRSPSYVCEVCFSFHITSLTSRNTGPPKRRKLGVLLSRGPSPSPSTPGIAPHHAVQPWYSPEVDFLCLLPYSDPSSSAHLLSFEPVPQFDFVYQSNCCLFFETFFSLSFTCGGWSVRKSRYCFSD